MGHAANGIIAVLFYFLFRVFPQNLILESKATHWKQLPLPAVNGTLSLLPCIPSLNSKDVPAIPCKVTLVITMCEQTNALNSVVPQELQKLKFSFSRQTNQTLSLIKSILLTMRHSRVKGLTIDKERELRSNFFLELIILSNNEDSFMRIKSTVDSWDEIYTQNFHLIYQNAIYLKGYKWMENLFAPCSTLRLLLPQLIPHVDSLIYTDTDTLLLQHVWELWNELATFKSEAQVGMVRSRRQFNARPLVQRLGLAKVPAYNSGVMLMNLTRLREDQNWKRWLVKGCQTYEAFLQWADQDIMDIYFHAFPRKLMPLPCLWNFVPPFFVNQSLCDPTPGVSLLHGIGTNFHKKGRIGIMYKKFAGAQLESSSMRPFCITTFLEDLNRSINSTDICQIYEDIHNCSDSYFHEAITKKLMNYS